MDLKKILQRIEARLKAVQKSADAAAKDAGKPDSIRNLKRAIDQGDRRGISTATIEALAPILRTTELWLTFGIGPDSTDPESSQIPVWGRAGAGGIVIGFHVDNTPIGAIDRPMDSNEDTSAVEIEGESLGRIFHGWYAIYDERRDPPTEDMYGKLCIVETEDGRVYIKKLTKGRGKKFTLRGNMGKDIENIGVAWAAEVKAIVPR